MPLRQGFSLNHKVAISASQPASELWDPSVFSPTSLGLQEFTNMPNSLFRSWWFELRSSCFQSKQAYSWGHLPSPFLGFDCNTSAIIPQLLDFHMCTLKGRFWFCSHAEIWRSGPASKVWEGALVLLLWSLVPRWATGWLRRNRLGVSMPPVPLSTETHARKLLSGEGRGTGFNCNSEPVTRALLSHCDWSCIEMISCAWW